MSSFRLISFLQFVLFLFLFICPFSQVQAMEEPTDSIMLHPDTIKAQDLIKTVDSEAAMEDMLMQMMQKQGEELAKKQAIAEAAEKRRQDSIMEVRMRADVTTLIPFHIGYADSIRMQQNKALQKNVHPLCMELVFSPIELDMDWIKELDFGKMYYGFSSKQTLLPESKQLFDDDIIHTLHTETRRQITREMADVYVSTFDQLPNPEKFKAGYIASNAIPEVRMDEKTFFDRNKENERKKLHVEEIALKKWITSASAILQATQNYISPNWYKGGNSNLAILGILSGSVNYDNKKNLTWENLAEWRAGFNSVSGDTIHKMSTNEDLFRLYSKFGLKAFNKFYYSSSVELKTQIFDTYTGVNSTKIKTAFFSPIRFNAAIGLDYKPNKKLSVVFSPVSYKYIYVRDTARIDQTSLGIEADRKHLSEVGSSLRIEHTWTPIEEISIVSKYYFYTNYEKIETELEVVCNFIVNRFLTTRISLHPRYDSTVIMKDDEKAKLQFKEMISFGFAYKL